MTRAIHAPRIAKSTKQQCCDVLRYVCDTCGVSHDTENDARDCEALHIAEDRAFILRTAEEFDPVNRPAHYADSRIEPIDFIEDRLGGEAFIGFCLGNVLKYVSRAGRKGDAAEDLRKAAWYLDRAIESKAP